MLIRDSIDVFIPYSMVIVCSYCKKKFTWAPLTSNESSVFSMPKYCSKTHANKASHVRKRERDRNLSLSCPTPHKQKYDKQEEAWKIVIARHYGDDELMPYKCKCGSFHNGHTKANEIKVA